ncbi:MAG: ATP-binding protein [Desulfitobacterium sp.]
MMTIQEMDDIPAFMTPNQIEQYGFVVDTEPPEPTICQFCNKELHYLGARSLSRKIIVRWKSEPERCTCEQSLKYWEEIEEAIARAEEERKQKEEQEAKRVRAEKLFNQSKMGVRFRNRTFDNFIIGPQNEKAYKTMKRYSENFKKYANQGIGFMLSGPYGSGKTHLAGALTIDLINKGVPVIFGTLISLLGKIRQTYSHNWTQEDELAILETYSTVDLLIIDDLGKERASEWSLEKLFSIVNARYENNLPIIITTNYGMETLIEKLSTNQNTDVAESIISRLHEMCRGIYLNDSDHRKAQN